MTQNLSQNAPKVSKTKEYTKNKSIFVTAKQISELQQTDTSPNTQTVSKGNSPFMSSQEEELNSPILEFQGFQWNFPKDTQNFIEFQDILQKETKRIKEAATNQL